ncbi:helix-turn-helix domain-containing protein [Massilia oculi]|uniref:helix-turn-helix domain-containing protein n=1 Tax=Massilia oculi TaxID=945844 RepID=UPI001AAF1631|nr:helix-turn-helix domain-containing protein [Massilia oculi]
MHHRTAAREAAMAKAQELLANGPLTAAELIAGLDVNRSTGFAYLRKLRAAGKVYATDEKRDGLALYALGTEPGLACSDDEIDAVFELKQYAARAGQVGMWRDPLVAALFGPARGAAA